MSSRTIAIRLKIPDNEAYTALTALRRLGVDLARLERAEVWTFEDAGTGGDFIERVERNETLFNPNKHELYLLDEGTPRDGEAWIETLRETDDVADDLTRTGRPIAGVSRGRRFVGWRLFSDAHTPADASTVRAAVEKLLCNPAIERAILS
jgi:phosphoribosylformylglycinamidine (FGAM) synthase PurS component